MVHHPQHLSHDADSENTSPDLIQTIQMLKLLAHSWQKRAQVRQFTFSETLGFDADKEDFLVDLLPFKDHPLFVESGMKFQSKILSCGWMIYNQKTLAIETEIIQPITQIILAEKLPGVANDTIRQVITETMIDETFHTLLVVNAMTVTKQKRNLSLKFPQCNLIKSMKTLQNQYSESWQKTLILLATAIISEIFISDYLKLMSESETIQPVNRMSVIAHREDELAHSNIFKYLTQCIYMHLSAKEKLFFATIFPEPIRWFIDSELEVWQSILQQLHINKTDMILAAKPINQQISMNLNYSNLISFAEDVGITNSSAGVDALFKAGIWHPAALS